MQLAVLVLLVLVRGLVGVAGADVGVVVAGDPNMQAPVMSHVQRWVQDKKQGLVAAPLAEASTAMIDCFVMDDVACARRVFEQGSRATTVVFVRVDTLTGVRSYELNTYWFTKGKEPVNEKRSCIQCDDAKLQGSIDALMIALVHKATNGMGAIKVPGPSEMKVKIDGTELGLAPIEREVTSGSHEVVFLDHGEPVDVRRVQVDEGAVVEVGAPHIAPAPAATAPALRSRVLPIALVVGGIAAAAVGGTLLYYGSLDGRDEPYVYTHATEIGLPLTIAGAFAVGAGTSLFISRSGDQGTVGVAGRF
jgi:hypothetical protein